MIKRAKRSRVSGAISTASFFIWINGYQLRSVGRIQSVIAIKCEQSINNYHSAKDQLIDFGENSSRRQFDIPSSSCVWTNRSLDRINVFIERSLEYFKHFPVWHPTRHWPTVNWKLKLRLFCCTYRLWNTNERGIPVCYAWMVLHCVLLLCWLLWMNGKPMTNGDDNVFFVYIYVTLTWSPTNERDRYSVSEWIRRSSVNQRSETFLLSIQKQRLQHLLLLQWSY